MRMILFGILAAIVVAGIAAVGYLTNDFTGKEAAVGTGLSLGLVLISLLPR